MHPWQRPLKKLAVELRSRYPRKDSQGNAPLFPPEGEVALMFLTAYLDVSDVVFMDMLDVINLKERPLNICTDYPTC